MTVEQHIARAFGLNERSWRRHANPWSVWTRNTVLPLLILAFWSRVWLGWWCMVPILFVMLWNLLNPHLFPPPKSMDNWASHAVLGERVWMARKEVPIPAHHRLAPNILSGVAATGALVVIYGVARLEIWPTVLGAILIYAGKLWFLDRMAWLYRDMRQVNEEYAG